MLDERYRDKMGLINNDDFKFASGAQQSQTYLKLSGPAFMYADASSDTGYLAKTTLEIYYDKTARDSGLVPMQIENLVIPVDPTGVYAIMYAGLKNRYSNTANVPTDIDTPSAPAAQPSTDSSSTEQAASAQPAPAAQPSTDSSSTEQPAAEQPASDQPQTATEQTASEQPATEQPTAEQPASDQPQPATEQPAAEQPAAEQPAAEQPATEQPANE